MSRPGTCVALFVALAVGITSAARAADTSSPSIGDLSGYQKLDPVLAFVRNRNAQVYTIDAKVGIAERSYVTLGGIDQWVTIRGENRDNPVLLFLHGGPGDVTNPWSFAVFAPWEKQFTVVQWDQRGSGRTLKRSGPSIGPTLTIERIAKDGVELADYLCRHLRQVKIVIVAHSFGTIVGLRMVQLRPERFAAYVGTGQVADETRNSRVAFDSLLTQARATHERHAIEELEEIGPPPYKEGPGYSVLRKWSNAFEGADGFLAATIGLALVSPGNSVDDINDSIAGQELSGEYLVPQAKSQTPRQLGLEFSVPIFFFQGAEDFTTPTPLAASYFESIKAPKKSFVAIEGGGHFAVFMKSDEFLRDLTKLVRPLAKP
jgi:pimeloyl-ACP methyl ester carboxylesterase